MNKRVEHIVQPMKVYLKKVYRPVLPHFSIRHICYISSVIRLKQQQMIGNLKRWNLHNGEIKVCRYRFTKDLLNWSPFTKFDSTRKFFLLPYIYI